MKEPLWTPPANRLEQANITRFSRDLSGRAGSNLEQYSDLWQWSVDNPADFWSAVWDFSGLTASRAPQEILVDGDKMPGAKWFPGAELNFARNLLAHRGSGPALIFVSESGLTRSVSFEELEDLVARCAAALKEQGVSKGDRVAGFVPNMIESVVAMLAATSLGAIWSSCSPDFGIKGVLDRFGQIEPKVLFCANGYFYGGKSFDSLERVASILDQLPSVKRVVVFPYTEERPDLAPIDRAVLWDDFLPPQTGELSFVEMPFDHPVYIMYSSGTTGVPKCIVHGAGGTLLKHAEEHLLQGDLKAGDRLFYFTTCGWMMWNWLVSGLLAGATLVLFDGNPFIPNPSALWQLAQDQRVTHFGTSARYLAAIEKEGAAPGSDYDLSALQTIFSTGSPLSVESFHYVYREIKKDVCLSSISGGTDIIGCFAGGCPALPVFEGELQCRMLGMAVESWGPQGQALIGAKGELVCTKPFPSMPVSFWNDPDGAKYHDAYFDSFPGVWAHGDFIEISQHGGVVIYGRSDATLNPGGVRIGTAEIYRPVENLEQVLDSLVVGQDWQDDVRVILFVKLAPEAVLDEQLAKEIKTTIRSQASPRHVPAKIIAVEDIPYTISGKKVELAVRQVIHGQEVLNRDALANPEALDLYADLAELKN